MVYAPHERGHADTAMAGKKAFVPDQALQQAMDLFWERGYEGSSVEDILAATGLGRGSLYATFGDKHALYLAALDRYCAAALEQMGAFLDRPGSPRAVLEELFCFYVDALAGDPAHRGCLLVNAHVELAPHDPNVFARVQAAYRAAEEIFFALLVRAQAAGELAEASDPRQFARFFLGTLVSIRVFARAKAERGVLADVVKTALLVVR
jgi:TetR/AcrR family transcriptional regulator, transcriptional repressor for nem operon